MNIFSSGIKPHNPYLSSYLSKPDSFASNLEPTSNKERSYTITPDTQSRDVHLYTSNSAKNIKSVPEALDFLKEALPTLESIAIEFQSILEISNSIISDNNETQAQKEKRFDTLINPRLLNIINTTENNEKINDFLTNGMRVNIDELPVEWNLGKKGSEIIRLTKSMYELNNSVFSAKTKSQLIALTLNHSVLSFIFHIIDNTYEWFNELNQYSPTPSPIDPEEGGKPIDPGEGSKPVDPEEGGKPIDPGNGNQINRELIDLISHTLSKVTQIRSKLGAQINRLNHSAANQENMLIQGKIIEGDLSEADWALEFSNMTRQNLLKGLSSTLIKENKALDSMVLLLIK